MSVKGGVGLSFAIFRKIFPTKELETLSPSEIEALGKVYAKWELIALPFVFVYAAASGYLWYLFLSYIGGVAARSHPDCVYLIVPDSAFWALPSVFLGIISASVPMHFTFKTLLGAGYDQYTLWTNLRHRFDGWKAFRVVSIAISIGSAFLIIGGLLNWDEFHEDRVVMKRPWAWGTRTYPYSQVEAIALVARSKAPNGNILATPHYAIRFNDGETWQTSNILIGDNASRDVAIVKFVAERSGRSIQQVDLIDEWKP